MALLRDSRHIGKLVITLDPAEPVPVRVPRPPVALDPEATYLVTGGLGGFGAATALWLARCGARHLALASRSGAAHPEARTVLARIADEGARATAYATDITDPAATRKLVAAIDATGHPLRGVINAAMVLAGNLRQSTYAAGNLAGEAIVRQRRAAGLPGLAVQWCAISDTGYADRAGMVDTMRRAGFGELDSTTATRVLGELITDPDADVVMVGNTDWAQTAKLLPAVAAPRFAEILPDPDADPHDADRNIPELVRSADEPEALRTRWRCCTTPAGNGHRCARLSVFGGLDDPMVDPGTLHEWGACTTADARVHHFPGGHHCLRTQVARVVGRLTDDLLAAYRSPASG